MTIALLILSLSFVFICSYLITVNKSSPFKTGNDTLCFIQNILHRWQLLFFTCSAVYGFSFSRTLHLFRLSRNPLIFWCIYLEQISQVWSAMAMSGEYGGCFQASLCRRMMYSCLEWSWVRCSLSGWLNLSVVFDREPQ